MSEAEGGVPTTGWAGSLAINSFDELVQHEAEILKRINALPNGPELFRAHPFLLLPDLGVDLSDPVKEEIIRREPGLRALSPVPYSALKTSGRRSSTRVRLDGLFRRETA
jgi:hypothetical protein